MEMYKSGDIIKMDWSVTAEIGMNQVITFSFYDNKIEFWKDQNNQYHVGMVYLKNGQEFRYKHYELGNEPKKWIKRIEKVKEMYDDIFPNVKFTNYN